jgi:hypothetical protein
MLKVADIPTFRNFEMQPAAVLQASRYAVHQYYNRLLRCYRKGRLDLMSLGLYKRSRDFDYKNRLHV